MNLEDSIPAEGSPHVRSGEIAAALNVSTQCVRAMVARGDLPAPLRLTPRLYLFNRSQVRAALRALRLAREGGAA